MAAFFNPSDSFIRQRRNLMLISVIMLSMKIVDLEITKVGLFGSEFNVENPASIYIPIWLFWIYFFYRYMVYYQQEAEGKLKQEFYSIFDSHFYKKAENIVFGEKMTYISRCLRFKSPFTLEFSGEFDGGGKFNKKIRTRHALKEIIIAFKTIILLRSTFSDIIIPIFFAVFVFIYCGFTEWDGNLMQLFQYHFSDSAGSLPF